MDQVPRIDPGGAQAQVPTASWRVRLAVRLAELDRRVERLPEPPDAKADADAKALARGYLAEARRGLAQRRDLLVAWRGADIEWAWQNTHAAEVQLVRGADPADAAARLPGIVAACRTALPKDPRLERLGKLPPGTALSAADRTLLADTLEAAYTVSDAQHMRARSFRNILLASTTVATLLAVLLIVAGFAAPGGIAVCKDVSKIKDAAATCPGGGLHPTGADVLIVLLLGLLGAAVSGVPAIRKLDGTATPYAVPLASLALKLPTGALTALLGVLLVRAGFASTVSADTQATVIGWAVVFGAAQQVFMQFVDRQARTVLNAVGSGSKDADPEGHATS